MSGRWSRGLGVLWVVAILVVLAFAPTMLRLFQTSATEFAFLDYAALEGELTNVVRRAIGPDSSRTLRLIAGEEAVRTESLLRPTGSLDRWSYSGRQLAILAHRMRAQDEVPPGGSLNARNNWVSTDHFSAERMIGRETGQVELHLNRGALNVLSPYTENRWSPVRSRDARSGLALVRDGSTLFFDPPARIPIPDPYPAGWCAAVRWSAESFGVRCGSAAGGLVSERFAEFRIGEKGGAFSGGRQIIAYRRNVTVEGDRFYPDTVRLRAGQLVRSDGLESGFIGLASSGSIVDTQRVNGRGRLVVASPRYGQIGIALSRVQRRDGSFSPIPVSLSPSLTATLDSVLKAVVQRTNSQGASRNLRVVNAEVVTVDIGNGDILALSGIRDPRGGSYLPGTTPRWLGSAIKPFIIAAVLSVHPELERMIATTGERVELLDGRALRSSFSAGCGGGSVDLRRGLRCSSNAFSAELLVRGIRASGVPMSRADTSRYSTLLASSPIALAMQEIWGTPLAERGGEPNPDPWTRNDRDGVGALFQRSNGGLLPLRSAPHLLVQLDDNQVGLTLDQVSRFAFGQGPNEWTLLDAAASFARIASGQRIEERFLAYGDAYPLMPAFDWRGASWHRTLLAGLTDVVRHPEGTASEVGGRVDRMLGQPVRLIGKTGTADLDEDGFMERNVFVGALSLTPSPPELPLRDGVAFALFVDYEDPRGRESRTAATAARREFRVHRELAAEVSAAIARYLVGAGVQTGR